MTPLPTSPQAPVAIVGAGPAGLIAAEHLSAQGVAVTVFDRMPSPGRKFLIAGRGGLNLTHDEPMARFLSRYGAAAAWIAPHLEDFPPPTLRAWADGLGAETFVGSSGRVFPKAMKATPLLRAWIRRLAAQGVEFRMRHSWLGWNEAGELIFECGGRPLTVSAPACLIALGGGSWPRLGSTGDWVGMLAARGVAVAVLEPSNCGFYCHWSDRFAAFAGEPLKNIALSAGGETVRGEAVVTAHGIEGGGVYELSRTLRETLKREGKAVLEIDLRPNASEAELAVKLAGGKRGQSQSNRLRKALRLNPLAINLMREVHGIQLPVKSAALAACVKHIPLTLTGSAPLARAISSAGGVALDELDGDLQLKRLPGVFAAGEMLDWDAPTGGYLLSACFATGVAAAKGILRHLGRTR